jgi:hypothetical protein
MSFKNGAFISAEWLKRQMQSIMNHQRSYRRRLMRDCLSDVAANEEPVRPPTISKEFWDFHIRAEIACSAWLGLYLAEKDLAEMQMMVEKGVIPTTHESIKATEKEIAEWKEKVGKSGVCLAELKTALKRAEKRGKAVTNRVGQGGQKIFVEKYVSGLLIYAILTKACVL